MPLRLDRLKRALFGDDPRALLVLATPTFVAVLLDMALRGRSIAAFAPQGKLIYASSLLVSAAFWMWPLWLASRLWSRRNASRAALSAFAVLWVLPLATFGYGGQALYHRVYSAYMGRDTLRLGVGLRGTVLEWLGSWGGPWFYVGMLGGGIAITAGLFAILRRARRAEGAPIAVAVAFVAALVVMWFDAVDSRFLQAATPDVCFVHGLVHALRVRVTGGGLRQGVSVRTPAPLPALTSERARPPNVVLVILESLRADDFCSDPPPRCRAQFLDEVVPDRLSLGKLTSQTPNTFSAAVTLATGLSPNVDFTVAHSAPVLWEIARAVGYRTAFITAQNARYEDYGLFFRRAGIDVMVTAEELGGAAQEHLGAPDENATAEALRFARAGDPSRPYFLVLQLSNTHWPYRVDRALEPSTPHSADPFGDVEALHNHYRNSVLLEERTVAAFVRELRAAPGWDDTVVLVVADHGEQFREHGSSYHNHSFFDEELRVPGLVAGGARALDDTMRAALATHAGKRTYLVDVNATVVDLFGVDRDRPRFAFSDRAPGRSLVRARDEAAPRKMLLATTTCVWEADYPLFGVMEEERLVLGAPNGAWTCFDMRTDPAQAKPQMGTACNREMIDFAIRGWGKDR